MSHYALVPRGGGEAIELTLPAEKDSHSHSHSQQQLYPNVSVSETTTAACVARDDLTRIYEQYAEQYPNPGLQQEIQERDRLLRAMAAASHASSMNPPPPKRRHTKGLFGYFFGGENGNAKDDGTTVPDSAKTQRLQDDPGDDERLKFRDVRSTATTITTTKTNTTDQDDDYDEDELCGTKYSLEAKCIPAEAHSLARFRLVSSRKNPNVARMVWERPGAAVLVVTALGEFVEYKNGTQRGQLQHTSDRDSLQEYAQERCKRHHENTASFQQLEYVRAAMVGPNFLIVSWGFLDGLVVFYRRILVAEEPKPANDKLKNGGSGNKNQSTHATDTAPSFSSHKVPVVTWEAVAYLGITDAVKKAIGDVFLEDNADGSNENASLRVTDVLPLVLETKEFPVASLAVARLGGFIELVPLPPRMWYGPEIKVPPQKKPAKKKRGAAVEHYCVGKIVNLAANHKSVTAFSVTEYHADIMGLEAFRTTTQARAPWNRAMYPDHPPAEHVLAAHGMNRGHEAVTFWSISTIFPESQAAAASKDGEASHVGAAPKHQFDSGFKLYSSLTEAIDLGPAGPSVSIFATKHIMKHWRKPRQVELRDANHSKGSDDDSGEASASPATSRVTTISVPVPVVALRFCIFSEARAAQIAVMDWNGGVTIMDCGLLERAASHSLTKAEHEKIYPSNTQPDDRVEEAIVPLATTIIPRFRLANHIQAATVTSIQWLLERWSRPFGIHPTLALIVQDPVVRLIIVSPADILGIESHEQRQRQHSNPPVMINVPGNHGVALHSLDRQGLMMVLCGRVTGRQLQQDDRVVRRCIYLCCMQQLGPRDIIQSLMKENKYKEALESLKLLSAADQRELASEIDQCRKYMWEVKRDLESLVSITDSAYVVNQALMLSTMQGHREVAGDEFEIFRAVHSLALERLSNATLVSQIAIAGLDGTSAIISELRSRIIKCGTYELLCRHFGRQRSMYKFQEDFFPVPVNEFAKCFARALDVQALLLICFRHKQEILDGIDILDETPVTTSPRLFQPLLPVCESGNLFMAEMDGRTFMEWANMPQYLLNTFGLVVTIDEDDQKIVSECQADVNRVEDAERVTRIETWYVNRALKIQRFAGNLQYTIDFCKMGLTAFGTSENIDQDTSPVSSTISQIRGILNRSEVLKTMLLDEIRFDENLPSSATLNPDKLEGMEIVDLVELVLSGRRSSAELMNRYRRYLLPIVESSDALKCGTNSLDYALEEYCIRLLQGCAGKSDKIEQIQSAMDICSTIASLSHTGTGRSKRLIKEKRILLDLFAKTATSVSKVCNSGRILPDNGRYILDALWTMYECLPKKSPPDHKDDTEFSELSCRVDEIYHCLVVTNILYQWPGCDPFRFMAGTIPTLGATALESQSVVYHEAICDICHSFCRQLGSHEFSSELYERTELMRSLLSDIKEISRCCTHISLDFSTILTEHLIKILLNQKQFQVLATFFKECDSKWIDNESVSHQILLFLDMAVFCQDKQEMIRSAIVCHDVLGVFFPSLDSAFLSVRRALDAANFLDTSLSAYAKGIKLRPDQLHKHFPLDVIENLLSNDPAVIFHECEEWSKEDFASVANQAIRDSFKSKTMEESYPTDDYNLPPLPGRALYHLAVLLGFNAPEGMAAVKCRVVHYALAGKFFGAAAAVCRNLMHEPSMSNLSEHHTVSVLDAISATVMVVDYGDVSTKKELCHTALVKMKGRVSTRGLSSVDKIMEMLMNTSFLPVDPLPLANSGLERLYRDTFSEYSSDLHELFTTLQYQVSIGRVDDDLLNTLVRYSCYWCIAQTTRPKSICPGGFDSIDLQFAVTLASSLLLHIDNKETAKRCVDEVTKILGDQARLAVAQFSKPEFVKPDEDIVRRLVGRGYSLFGAQRAAIMSRNADFDAALKWAVAHSVDETFDNPIALLKAENELFVDMEGIDLIQISLTSSQRVVTGQLHVRDLSNIGLVESGLQSSLQGQSSPKRIPQPTLNGPLHSGLVDKTQTNGVCGVVEDATYSRTAESPVVSITRPENVISSVQIGGQGTFNGCSHSGDILSSELVTKQTEKLNALEVGPQVSTTSRSKPIEFRVDRQSVAAPAAMLPTATKYLEDETLKFSVDIMSSASGSPVITTPFPGPATQDKTLATSSNASSPSNRVNAAPARVAMEPDPYGRVEKAHVVSATVTSEVVPSEAAMVSIDTVPDASSGGKTSHTLPVPRLLVGAGSPSHAGESLTPRSAKPGDHPVSANDSSASREAKKALHVPRLPIGTRSIGFSSRIGSGSSPKTSTTPRESLRDRGEAVFQATRKASNQLSDERRRLIEEGRRLLQRARASAAKDGSPKSTGRVAGPTAPGSLSQMFQHPLPKSIVTGMSRSAGMGGKVISATKPQPPRAEAEQHEPPEDRKLAAIDGVRMSPVAAGSSVPTVHASEQTLTMTSNERGQHVGMDDTDGWDFKDDF